MQKFFTVAFSSLLIFSCTSSNIGQRAVNHKLKVWDKTIYEKPEAVLDSLKSLDTIGLSKKNSAYYSLLVSIAKNKSGILQREDSSISAAAVFFEKKKDYGNLCRALLNKGIVLYNLNRPVIDVYTPLKSAEDVYKMHRLDDRFTEVQIYRYLGKTHRINRNFSKSEMYLNKSARISDSIGNKNESQLARLDLFWTLQMQNKKREAYRSIVPISIRNATSPIIRYNFYNAMARYFSADGRIDLSIRFLHKMLSISDYKELKNLDHSGVYYAIAANYRTASEIDSTLFYGQKAIQSSRAHFHDTPPSYYRLMGEMFALKDDYKNAFENYRNAARISEFSSFSGNVRMKPEVENEYRLNKKTAQLVMAKGQLKLLYGSAILLTICFFSVLIALRIMRRDYRQCMNDKEKQNASIEAELRRARFVNLIHETSVGALPKLVDDVNKHACRSRKFSSELSDDLNDSITSIRSLSKNNLSAIAQSEAFLAANPNVKYLTALSDLEIIILILVDLKFNTREISELLNNTPASVRAIKTKIKDKILATSGLPFDPESTFLIFAKDHNHRNLM